MLSRSASTFIAVLPLAAAVLLAASPVQAQAQPYGIVYTKGALWYNEAFAKPSTIVRFDPATEQFQTWTIPGGGDIVRNMDGTAIR